VTKDNSGAQETFYAQPSWKGVPFPLDTVRLYPALDLKPEVHDIRVILCPTPARNIRLSNFLDSLNYANTIQWVRASASSPDLSDVSSGEINTGSFYSHGVHTYQYIRHSECMSSSSTAKAYVYIPHGKTPPRPDTVLVCVNKVETININSILGLEYGGVWRYDNSDGFDPDGIVSDNSVEINSTSQNVLMFNVKAAHEEADAQYDVTYRGVSGKQFVFDYIPTSTCNSSTTRIVIVSYNE
jgi:hypothetical protein